MKTKLIDNPDHVRIINQVEKLYMNPRWEQVAYALSIDEIASICATLWDTVPSSFIGKINHKDPTDKYRKVSFLYCCRVFSNSGMADVVDYAQNTYQMFRNCTSLIYREVQYGRSFKEIIIRLITTLNNKSKGRLFKLWKVDFSMLKAYWLEWRLNKLDSYQIGKIPLRDADWIHNNNDKRSILCYNLHDEQKVIFFIHGKVSDDDTLLSLQDQGYRYLDLDSRSDIDSYKFYCFQNRICDRCINKNGCKIKFYQIDDEDKSECFKEISTDPLKVPLHFLFPLQQYQLQ